jgi:hypothetical protein
MTSHLIDWVNKWKKGYHKILYIKIKSFEEFSFKINDRKIVSFFWKIKKF